MALASVWSESVACMASRAALRAFSHSILYLESESERSESLSLSLKSLSLSLCLESLTSVTSVTLEHALPEPNLGALNQKPHSKVVAVELSCHPPL